MNDLSKPLALLLEIVRGVIRGDPAAIHDLDAMTGSVEIPPLVVELAEQINNLSIQNEAREFRLELMIEDLLGAQIDLINARHDPLTGLPNRGLFHELLQQTCADAKQMGQTLALLFIDLDKFKQVNDTMGHDAGDELLIQVSQRLSSRCRQGDILARLGGDEFTMSLCQPADQKTVTQIAEKIVAEMNTPFSLSMGQAHIGASIGISFFPKDANQALTLMKNADVAMYWAKGEGRNTYRLYQESR